jgi:hypothetical protein
MKDNRNRLAKTYLTDRQFDDLTADAQACGDSISDVLRRSWLACRNVKARRAPITRPSLVPSQSKFAPGRGRPQMHAFRS